MPSSPLLTCDVFLLCFSIADHSSLYTAVDHWLPLVKEVSPGTPVVLVGCKSDLRTSGRLQRLVSAEHGLALSKQAAAAMYLETSSITTGDNRSAAAAFEVASLAALGQFPRPPPAPRPAPRGRAQGRRETSEPRAGAARGAGARLNCLAVQQGEPYQALELCQSRSGSVSSVSLQSKSSTLSSTTSDSSATAERRPAPALQPSPALSTGALSANLSSPVLRVSTGRTPSVARRVMRRKEVVREEEMVTIKCQRLREDRTYEEIEIEVPAGVYHNIQSVRGGRW